MDYDDYLCVIEECERELEDMRAEITQLRAELAAERELADRFRMVLLIHKGSNGWGLAEQEVLECYRTRRNK